MIGETVKATEVGTLPNPFPGLRTFEFSESLLFFGRDGQSEQLIRKLKATHFLAIVGTSGSGKSSLVRAGLWPALFGGFMASAGSNWRLAIMRPSNNPIGNLAAALNTPDVLRSQAEIDAELQTAITEAALRRGSLGLVETVRQARMRSHENLLVVVDQFEELFRFARVAGSDEYRNDAAAFVKLLLEASCQRDVPIYIVITMRSDFLGDCSIFWDLPEAINEGQYLIPRMTRDELREAITGPVAVFGTEITPRLVNRLLNDMGDNPDHLPILQHALMRTWNNWKEDHQEDEPLDLGHYEAIGTMSEALSQHADEAYDELADVRSKEVAEKIFKGLTEKGPDNREVRRPTELRELCTFVEAGEPEVVAVIEVFREKGRAFLMPPNEVPLNEKSLIDISHESLIRNWQRLKDWVDQEARSARIYKRLAETAILHEAGEEGLLKEPALQVAVHWHETNHPNKVWGSRYHPEFQTAMSFLDESIAAREVEERERGRQKTAAVRYKVTLLSAGMLVVLLVLALGGVVYSWRQKQIADQQRRRADSLFYRTTMNLAAVVDLTRARQLIDGAKSDSRGFEWYYLWRALHGERATVDCSSDFCVAALSPDGRMVAISARDAVELWDVASLTKLKTIQGDSKDVGALVFSPDTKILAIITQWMSVRRSLKLFDVATSRELASLDGSGISSVAFSPDGKLLAAGSQDHDISLCDVTSLRVTARLTHNASVLAVAFSPDGKTLAGGGSFGDVSLWDVTSHKRTGVFKGQAANVYSIAFSPDGKTLAAAGEDKSIKLWDASLRKDVSPVPQNSAAHSALVVAFSPDGKMLAIGYEDGGLQILDAASKKELATLRGHQGGINYLAFTPDSKLLVSGSVDRSIKLWDTTARIREQSPLIGHTDKVNAVAFSPDRKLIATGSDDNAVRLWDANTHEKVATVSGHTGIVQSVAFSSDGKLLATGGWDKTVRLWDVAKHEAVGEPLKHSGRINSVAFAPDGRTLATGSADGGIKLWDVASQRELKSLPAFSVDVKCVTFSPDGKFMAAGFSDGSIRVWENGLNGERELRPDSQEAGSANSLAFSSNSRMLAIGIGDRVELWETATLKRLARLEGHARAISSVAFSPDRRRLASASIDGTVKLWDVESLPETDRSRELDLITLKADTTVCSVAFSPDGGTLAAAGLNFVKVWHAASVEEVNAQINRKQEPSK